MIYANLVSWFAGVVIGFLLPSGLVPKPIESDGHQVSIITQGPRWMAMALASFVVACPLSIGIEYTALLPFQKRKFPFNNLGRCTTYANITSYVVLSVLVWIHLQFIR